MYIPILHDLRVHCVCEFQCTYELYISLACKGGGKGGAMALKLHLD